MNNEDLQKRVDELMRWKESKERQQIVLPFDHVSQKIIQKDLLVATGLEVPIILTDSMSFGLEVTLNGRKTALYASLPLRAFTANAGTNVCTYGGGVTALVDGDRIVVASTNTLPAPLDEVTVYYIISATATTFKLSLTSGGGEIDITSAGTGVQYFGKI